LIDGGGSIAYARTLAFTTLVLYELVDVFCIRSDEVTTLRGLFRNSWVWLAVATGLTLQMAVIYVPTLQQAFGTVPLDAADWLTCAAVASTIAFAREAGKAWWRAADRRVAATPGAQALTR
jgi:Ca2+-transporting ATPase